MHFTQCNAWTPPVRIPLSLLCNYLTGSIDRYIICVYAKVVNSKFENKYLYKLYTFVWFLICNVLNIQPIPVCHVSNERKLISDQLYNLLFLWDYTLRVMINLLVSYYFNSNLTQVNEALWEEYWIKGAIVIYGRGGGEWVFFWGFCIHFFRIPLSFPNYKCWVPLITEKIIQVPPDSWK